jgi:hypothetical protein
MRASQRWEENSDLGSLLPSLQGIVEALSGGRMPATLAPLHEFLDNDLRPSLRMVGVRCCALEFSQEHGLLVTLLARDVSDMEWYAARIKSALQALGQRNGTYLSSGRSLVALFTRLLSVVELATIAEAEIGRADSSQVSVGHGVTDRGEEL